jgi:ribonuclease P/MRP protein subunit POP5
MGFGICAIPVLVYYQNKIMANKKNIKTQKTLMPTLKENKRYVVIRIKGATMSKAAYDEVLSQCSILLGVFDGAKAGLMAVKYDDKTNNGILRVNNAYVDKLKVCLGMIKTINNTDVLIDCINVSGMLNKAEKVMLQE